jgi:NADH-quinone oxidoreductase subunit J
MNLFDIIFFAFALMTLASACIVVFSRNILYSAFSLLFTFLGVAGLYILLNADFLAVTQLLVYVGGILVLIIFGVMLTNNVVKTDIKIRAMNTAPAVIIVAVMAAVLCAVLWSTEWPVIPTPDIKSTSAEIGRAFLTNYLLPFEIASVVLLVVLVGAVMIARWDKKDSDPGVSTEHGDN